MSADRDAFIAAWCVHIHALVLDGVFARDRAEALRFHPTRRLTTLDVAEVLATVEPFISRGLERRGLGPGEADAPDAWTDEAPVLAGLAAASVQGTIALGPRRGARVRRLGDAAEPVETPAPGHCHARANGFDLHAGLVVPGGQRERLERICRYALRPPVTQERLHLAGDGQVRLELRHPWRDGTTDIVFDPVEFLRLAVLVPRPRINYARGRPSRVPPYTARRAAVAIQALNPPAGHWTVALSLRADTIAPSAGHRERVTSCKQGLIGWQ